MSSGPSEAVAISQARDGRTAARRRSYFHGKIISGDGAFSLDCVIRNLSDSGAKIQIRDHEIFPLRFFLLCTVLKRTFEAEVTWRKEGAAGVKFHSVHDMTATLPSQLRAVRRIYIEHCARTSADL
jgi:hypothetical protein